MSRDPIEELAFRRQLAKTLSSHEHVALLKKGLVVNLYRFCRNGSPNNIDTLGLIELRGICCTICAADKGATAYVATRWGLGLDPGDDRKGGPNVGGNAVLHCMASCLTAKYCREECAKEYWDGEEKGDSYYSKQDLYNNAAGRAGAAHDCALWCYVGLKNGKLACYDSEEDAGNGRRCPPPVSGED